MFRVFTNIWKTLPAKYSRLNLMISGVIVCLSKDIDMLPWQQEFTSLFVICTKTLLNEIYTLSLKIIHYAPFSVSFVILITKHEVFFTVAFVNWKKNLLYVLTIDIHETSLIFVWYWCVPYMFINLLINFLNTWIFTFFVINLCDNASSSMV